jgi:hypothetical protein
MSEDNVNPENPFTKDQLEQLKTQRGNTATLIKGIKKAKRAGLSVDEQLADANETLARIDKVLSVYA